MALFFIAFQYAKKIKPGICQDKQFTFSSKLDVNAGFVVLSNT